jgi:hypothetical protein
MGVKSALLGVAFFFSIGAFATDPIILFSEPGVPVLGYNSLVDRIQEGNSLRFSNGRVWQVERVLGRGESSFVFASQGRAVRISRFAGLYDHRDSYKDLLNEILDGNAVLRRRLVPVIEVFPEESLRGEYVVQEELLPPPGMTRIFSLEEFLDGTVNLSRRSLKTVNDRLVDFAVRCSGFRRFGDQSPKQILYTSTGWRLADYRKNHILASSANDPMPFQFAPTASPAKFMSCADSVALLFFSTPSSDPSVLPLPGSLIERVRRLSVIFRHEQLSI